MIDEKKREKNKNFHLPRLHYMARILIYILTLTFGILSMIATLTNAIPVVFTYAIYTAAGCLLTASIIYIVPDIRYFYKSIIKNWINGTPIAFRLTNDIRYRVLFITMFSFGANLIYAIFNGALGIIYSSWWFVTLSAYYIVLTFMRSIVLIREKRSKETNDKKKEWATCKHCGISLIILDIALMGSVILVVVMDSAKTYPEIMIYAVAAYTFTKIGLSIFNMFRVKKIRDTSVLAVRCIGFADALMSILSLQTAMFVSFGNGTGLKVWMNALTGAVICLMILGLGISMIVKSGKKIKLIEN